MAKIKKVKKPGNKRLATKKKFDYQLTDFYPRTEIQFAIDQIEKYEPNSEGFYYIVKEEGNKCAVFTHGIYLTDNLPKARGAI